MQLKTAETLVEALGKHPGIITPDKDLFIDLLMQIDVPESSRFYERIPGNKQELTESDCSYSLSLRRVLRNRNSERNYSPGIVKRALDALASWRGIYSSDVLTRRLRQDNEIVDLMQACLEDFSLLAKFETYDYSDPNKLTVTTRPVLVIPGAENDEQVMEWEEANTLYQKGKETLKKVKYAKIL
ncbi:hypothetical protein KY343_05955 [Candidatus Woesearchaeota archaeon]|nr:hypothetical protein [Candidatus Woesearchaeota archaeon]